MFRSEAHYSNYNLANNKIINNDSLILNLNTFLISIYILLNIYERLKHIEI